MLVWVVRLQALYRFVNLRTFLFIFALYLTLLHNFIFGLLLDELVDGELLLLLEGFEFNPAIVEDFLDLWVQIFEVLLELPFHEGSVFGWTATLREDLAKLSLVAQLDSQIGVLVHLLDKLANFLDVIVTLGGCSTRHAAFGGWVDHTA